MNSIPIRWKKRTKKGKMITTHVALGIFMIYTLFPLYWMVNTSLKPKGEIMALPIQWIPHNPSLEHYIFLLSPQAETGLGGATYPTFFFNSLIISIITLAITLPLAILAGYSFSRFRYKARRTFLNTFVMTTMIPSVLILLSIYILLKDLYLLNNRIGLVLCYITIALPFSTLLMKSYFDGLPREIEEAALVEGCGRIGAMIRVTLPLSAPGVVASAIYIFLECWNEFIFAFTIMSDRELWTATVGIQSFMTAFYFDWGRIMAGSFVMTIPVVILFIFLQKYFVRGLTAGAVKF